MDKIRFFGDAPAVSSHHKTTWVGQVNLKFSSFADTMNARLLHYLNVKTFLTQTKSIDDLEAFLSDQFLQDNTHIDSKVIPILVEKMLNFVNEFILEFARYKKLLGDGDPKNLPALLDQMTRDCENRNNIIKSRQNEACTSSDIIHNYCTAFLFQECAINYAIILEILRAKPISHNKVGGPVNSKNRLNTHESAVLTYILENQFEQLAKNAISAQQVMRIISILDHNIVVSSSQTNYSKIFINNFSIDFYLNPKRDTLSRFNFERLKFILLQAQFHKADLQQVHQEDHEYAEKLKAFNKANKDLNEPLIIPTVSPVYYAAFHGHVESIKVLLAAKKPNGKRVVNFNQLCKLKEATPLSVAARNGHDDVVKILVEAKDDQGQALIDIHSPNDQLHPIVNAIVNGHAAVVKIFLAIRHPNGLPVLDLNKLYAENHTLLSIAVNHGQPEMVKMLLDVKDRNGNRVVDVNAAQGIAVLDAVENDSLESLNILIAAGCDLNKQHADGSTPVRTAVTTQKTAILQRLVNAGAELDTTINNSTPTFGAAARGYVDEFKILITAKKPDGSPAVDLNKVDNDGMSVDFIAVAQGHVSILTVLANTKKPNGDSALDLTREDNKGRTLAFYAAECDQAEVLKFFLELKTSDGKSMIDINWANETGETLAYTAAAHNAVKVLKLLIAMGADMNKADINAATPLHASTFNKSEYEAYEFLLESEKPDGTPAVDPTLLDDSGLQADDYLSSGAVESMRTKK